MPQLEQDLRAGLAALAPEVPTDGVFDQVAVAHRTRLRRRRGRRVGALTVLAAASVALVVGLVPGGGHDESDRVVAGLDGLGEVPRLVPTWLPDGFELHSVWTRPIRPSPAHLRAQVFTGTGDEGAWRLQIDTSDAPLSSPRGEALVVRGVSGRSSGERPSRDSLTTIQWEENGRYYEAAGYGLSLAQTLRLVEELELRDGDRAGVELPGREMVEDRDPHAGQARRAIWFDYTFVAYPGESAEFGHLFSIHVHWGVPSDTAFGWPSEETEEITVRQQPARSTSSEELLAVNWWEAPGTHVSITATPEGLDLGDLLRVAEELRNVDQATWDAFVDSGSEQPAVEASGSTGEVTWRRFGPARTFLEVTVAGRNTAYLEPHEPWPTSLFHEGRWWTFLTTSSDVDVVALRVIHPDGTTENLTTTEVTGAWQAPHKLLVAVSDAHGPVEPQATHLVTADGTQRPLDR